MYIYTLYKNMEDIPSNEVDIMTIANIGGCLEHWETTKNSELFNILTQASIAASKLLDRIRLHSKSEEFGISNDIYYVLSRIVSNYKIFSDVTDFCCRFISDEVEQNCDDNVEERIAILIDFAYDSVESFADTISVEIKNNSMSQSEKHVKLCELKKVLNDLNTVLFQLSGESFTSDLFSTHIKEAVEYCHQLKGLKKSFKWDKEFNELLFKLFNLVEASGMHDPVIDMEIEMFRVVYGEDKQEDNGSREDVDTTNNKYVKISNSTGAVFPDDDYLDDYKDSHITDLMSTLGIDVTIGNGLMEIGDSGISIEIQNFVFPGDVECKRMKAATKEFIDIVRTALSAMSKKYADFYEYFLDDFEKNGFNMPGL